MRRVDRTWKLETSVPAREIFAVMEQMIGTHPYRFEVLGENSARIVEFERKGFFGNWKKKPRNPRWVRLEVTQTEQGQEVKILTSKGKAPHSRARQMEQLLRQGAADTRTIYRDRHIPEGPVTLVASWAGMPYKLFEKPQENSKRGKEILTATPMNSLARYGNFLKVELEDGTQGYVELDQVVAAPQLATREAQEETALVTGDSGGQRV